MAILAEAILAKSLQSLWRRDVALAREVRIDDLDIDRSTSRSIDGVAHPRDPGLG
jgi:hypothetical protein